jgi:Uma2 family endonuclease
MLRVMQGLVFESTVSLSSKEFADFVAERAAAGDHSHYELLNGRVVMNPPAGYPHGRIGSKVQALLSRHVDEHGLGEIFDSSQGFELPSGDTVQPDHSFVSRARWDAAPAPEFDKFLKVVPDLIVEVLSTSTAAQDRGEKKAIYERNGVREYWLVDPRARTLTVLLTADRRFDEGRCLSESERWSSGVLAGLEFEVCTLLV